MSVPVEKGTYVSVVDGTSVSFNSSGMGGSEAPSGMGTALGGGFGKSSSDGVFTGVLREGGIAGAAGAPPPVVPGTGEGASCGVLGLGCISRRL